MMRAMRPLLLSVLLLAVLVPRAGAQSVTMEPAQLDIGSTDRVTFRLALPAGKWTVTMEVPAFVAGHSPFGSRDPLDPYGTPFTPAGPPAAPAGSRVSGGDPGTAGLGNVCRRGFDAPANAFATITMPAAGTVAWGFWLSKAQRWSATDYRVAFRVRGEDGRSVRVLPAEPVVTGPFGTRFRFGVRRLSRGVYRVAGTTQPVLARARVSLITSWAEDHDGRVSPNYPDDFTRGRAIATFRTDGRGRFSHRWRPGRGRVYAIWAGSFNANGRLGDSSCPLRIDT